MHTKQENFLATTGKQMQYFENFRSLLRSCFIGLEKNVAKEASHKTSFLFFQILPIKFKQGLLSSVDSLIEFSI